LHTIIAARPIAVEVARVIAKGGVAPYRYNLLRASDRQFVLDEGTGIGSLTAEVFHAPAAPLMLFITASVEVEGTRGALATAVF